jgi:hypothetical protein
VPHELISRERIFGTANIASDAHYETDDISNADGFSKASF